MVLFKGLHSCLSRILAPVTMQWGQSHPFIWSWIAWPVKSHYAHHSTTI